MPELTFYILRVIGICHNITKATYQVINQRGNTMR